MPISVGRKTLRTLEELDASGKTVFCRVDFNVPYVGDKVEDDTRIRAALPTIQYLLKQKARILLASHLGRPKGVTNAKYSLLPVAQHLAELLQADVVMPDNCIGNDVRRALQERRDTSVFLLENLRFHAEEEKNDPGFAKSLRNGADLYVTEAFGSLHRAHASTDALPRLFEEKAIGLLVQNELQFLTPLMTDPARPFAVVLGGAKVSDKINVIEHFVRKVDAVFLGGAMAFTFLKALGHKVGNSLVEEDKIPHAKRILSEATRQGKRIFLPKDFQLGKSLDDPGSAKACEGIDVPEGWMGLDIGPRTLAEYEENLSQYKTIFWNGPMGLFEKPPFDQGTVGIAQALAKLDAVRIVGGGDSVAALKHAGVADRMTHISTGGGATLEFLEGKPLPGLESLAV